MPRQKITPDALLRSATAVFRRHGYASTSMSMLAEAAGLTKGAYYHHYRDKGAVMRACLRGFTAFAKTRAFAPARDASVPLPERVDALVATTRRLFAREAGGCLVANTALETAGAGSPFREELRAFIDAWVDAIAALATEAGLSEPRGFAERRVAAIEGAIVMMQVYDASRFLDEALAALRAQLLTSEAPDHA